MKIKNSNFYAYVFLLASFTSSLPAMSAAQQVKRWAYQQYKKVETSIKQHPWHYAAGLTATVAAVGLGVYLHKKNIEKAALDQAIKNALNQSVPLPSTIFPANDARAAVRQLLWKLREASTADMMKVDIMMARPQYGRIDLESFHEITNTNCIAPLHNELKEVNLAFSLVAGYQVDPPAHQKDLNDLKEALLKLSKRVNEAYEKYRLG